MESGIMFGNRIVDVVFVAWFIAQFYKVITALIFEKKFDVRRIWGTGGMPSSHSSTVTALATSVGIAEGVKSSNFAIALILAMVVMYDAAGIRRAAGQQAGVLNKLVQDFANKIGESVHDENLKELLGHTPIEVLVGAILGVIVGFSMQWYILM